MSVLKVTEVQSEEVANNDEVVAGQVRMSADKRFTVLIISAQYSPFIIEKSDSAEAKFLTVVLKVPKDYCWINNFDLNERFNTTDGDRISERFPILLDAELTYKEAK